MIFRQTCRTLVTRTTTLLSRPLSPAWSVSWPWFRLQVVFALGVIYLSVHLPAPGISIGVLGLLAVVATFERDPSSIQRSIWIVVATGLLLVEVSAVANDRLENQGEQANARAIDQTRFLKTAIALQRAINDEEDQTNKEQTLFKKTFTRFNDVVNTETGGNSFFYLSFSERYGGQTFDIKAVRVGKYPIKRAWAIIDDLEKGSVFLNNYPKSPRPRTLEEVEKLDNAKIAAERSEVPLFDFATDTLSIGPYFLASPQSADYQQYTISLGAINGLWYEEILMQRLPGPYLGEPYSGNHHWSQAITVSAPGNPKPLLSKIDPDYPIGTDGKPVRSGLTVKHAPR
jgi:hypothetical protein